MLVVLLIGLAYFFESLFSLIERFLLSSSELLIWLPLPLIFDMSGFKPEKMLMFFLNSSSAPVQINGSER